MTKFYLNNKGITALTRYKEDFFILRLRRLEDGTVFGGFYKVVSASIMETTKKESIKELTVSDMLFDEKIRHLFRDYLDCQKENRKKDHTHDNGWGALENIRVELRKLSQEVL